MGAMQCPIFFKRIRPTVHRAKTMLTANPTASHHLITSLIQSNYQMITKTSTEWQFEGHL